MTSAKRTSIRGRLAIRRAAHRPPWGVGKARHGSIVAPLAATLATGMAVGMVGLAMARSERERRRAQRRDHDRRLRLRHDETLADGLRRMAVGQLDLAIELLDPATGTGGAPDERAVHDTRKAIKRLRALLRLLRRELGERAYKREDDTLRAVARRLSGARDASVMLATLDALIEHQPRKLGRRRGAIALRRRLAADSACVGRHTLADPRERAELLGELHALRWRVSAWSLPPHTGVRLIEADLHRVYRQGRVRAKLAARRKGGRRAQMLAMHSWRKRVKDLRYAAEMLERRGDPCANDTPTQPQRARDAHDARAAAKSLRKLAARADRLGEVLGQEHDLAVLEAHVRAGARRHKRGRRQAKPRKARTAEPDVDALWHTGRGTRKALLRAIAKRRRVLRKRALRHGRRLYAHKPRQFMRRLPGAS
jgi:CHAD domain-containing protein